MFSILIPTYNFDVYKLVHNVHTQLNDNKINFEIIVFEDGSKEFENKIKDLKNVEIIYNEENIGRVKARQFLAKKAKYDWLIFLDADVIPKRNHFILNYLNATLLDYDVVFGGFAYYQTKPGNDYLLRWKYGKEQEEVFAFKRNKTPYKIIISANYMIKKTVFNAINFQMNAKGYGYDNYYGALLKQYNTKVLHIDNEVYHLGIEKSRIYLKKKEQAAITLLKLLKEENITVHDNQLLGLYLNLKKFKSIFLLSGIYRLFSGLMKKNLTGNNPSIKILQLYRISFMCYISKNDIV